MQVWHSLCLTLPQDDTTRGGRPGNDHAVTRTPEQRRGPFRNTKMGSVMPELLAVALVCATTLSSVDCSRDTALDIIVAPAHSAMECVMHAQASAASAGLPGGEGRYLKIVCERRTKLAAVAEPVHR